MNNKVLLILAFLIAIIALIEIIGLAVKKNVSIDFAAQVPSVSIKLRIDPK